MSINNYEPLVLARPIKVLGIDPGVTTGYALLSVTKRTPDRWHFDVLRTGEIPWHHRFIAPNELVKQADIVVMEAFRLYPHTAKHQGQIHSSFPSVEIIGITKSALYTVYEEHWEDFYFEQQASSRKNVTVLPDHSSLVVGDHARDAYRHARYWIVTKLNKTYEEGYTFE